MAVYKGHSGTIHKLRVGNPWGHKFMAESHDPFMLAG